MREWLQSVLPVKEQTPPAKDTGTGDAATGKTGTRDAGPEKLCLCELHPSLILKGICPYLKLMWLQFSLPGPSGKSLHVARDGCQTFLISPENNGRDESPLGADSNAHIHVLVTGSVRRMKH